MANSLGEYTRIWLRRVRSGESGALPVIIGLIAIGAYFQISQHAFLSAGNIANLMTQAGVPDHVRHGADVRRCCSARSTCRSASTRGIGATITLWMVAVHNPFPTWAADPCRPRGLRGDRRDRGPDHRLAADPLVRGHAGRPARPERGAALAVRRRPGASASAGSSRTTTASSTTSGVRAIMSPTAGWIVLIVAVVAHRGLHDHVRDRRRRAHSLVAPPLSVTLLKIGVMAAVRPGARAGAQPQPRRRPHRCCSGVPWVVPIVLGLLRGH